MKNMLHHGGMKKIIILILVQFLVVPFSLTAFSQAKVQEKIVSEDDQFLSIKTLVVAPLIDNVSGIYGDAVNSMLKTSLEDDHRWELLAWKAAPGTNTKALDSDGEFSKSYLKNLGADAV